MDYYKMDRPKVGPVFVYVGENKEKRNIKAVVVKPLSMMYLSKTNDRPEFPIRGIMMGKDRRCFVNLICRIGSGNSVYVNFLLDSTSGSTYLNDDTIKELTDSQNIIQVQENFIVNIHGTNIDCHRSNCSYIDENGNKMESHFNDINILGTAYLEKTHLEVVYKYYSLSVLLIKEDRDI